MAALKDIVLLMLVSYSCYLRIYVSYNMLSALRRALPTREPLQMVLYPTEAGEFYVLTVIMGFYQRPHLPIDEVPSVGLDVPPAPINVRQ